MTEEEKWATLKQWLDTALFNTQRPYWKPVIGYPSSSGNAFIGTYGDYASHVGAHTLAQDLAEGYDGSPGVVLVLVGMKP